VNLFRFRALELLEVLQLGLSGCVQPVGLGNRRLNPSPLPTGRWLSGGERSPSSWALEGGFLCLEAVPVSTALPAAGGRILLCFGHCLVCRATCGLRREEGVVFVCVVQFLLPGLRLLYLSDGVQWVGGF